MTATSLAARMEATRGRSTGFDYLRLTLAVAIIAWHSFGTSYGLPVTYRFMAGPGRTLIAAILPMFFALSGFLVAGSLERAPTLWEFIALRILRIAPALVGEVALSALVLGPLLTTLPLGAYFANPKLWSYSLNVLGYIHYALPGLFTNNPIPGVVNGQLWTIPRELACYAALVGLAILGVAKRPGLLAGGIAITSVAFALWHAGDVAARLAPARVVADIVLILSFLSGVALHGLRHVIPWNAKMFWLSAAAAAFLLSFPAGDYLVAVALAYATVFVGLLNPRKLFLLRGADYSYGLFLYGWAVQQATMALGRWTHHWYINLAIALPATTLVAACSWRVIEKPALGLRRHLPSVEGRMRELRGRLGLP